MKNFISVGLLFVSAVLIIEAVTPTYHVLNINGNNYCLSKDSSYTKLEAETYCTEIGAELAMFDDNAEYHRVFKTMADNSTFAKQTWITFNYRIAKDFHLFYWKNELFDSSVWATTEPNDNCPYTNTPNVECCARMRFTDEGLADRDCTIQYAFLCKVQCSSGVTKCSVTCGDTVKPVQCLAGYVFDVTSMTCLDVNECDTAVSQCQQTCSNSKGSYKCGCHEGYTLNADNSTCVDINECIPGDTPCQQNCTNSVGSFHCSCVDGFTLNEDNRTCVDVNECLNGSSTCQQNCNNTIGSFTCSCDAGYSVSENGVECIKLDECLVTRCERQCQNGSDSCLVGCHLTSQLCEHDCVNYTGTHECTCRRGYSLNTTSETACHDIDECSLNTSLCEVYCNNTPGSYYCSCPQGYHLSEDKYACLKSTPHNYCPCSCSFNAKKLPVNEEQMTSYLVALSKSLEVDKGNLLSTRLLAESQPDERPSSNAIGYVGLMFVSIVLALMILPDFITLMCAVINKIKSFNH